MSLEDCGMTQLHLPRLCLVHLQLVRRDALLAVWSRPEGRSDGREEYYSS